MRAILKMAGMNSEQYLNEQPGTIDSIVSDILSNKPKVVGFTVYDANFTICLALAGSVKRQCPEVRVIFGGPTATFGAENILTRHEMVDFCICGETEEIGPDIFQMLLDGSDMHCEALPGIAFRRNGRVICTDLPPLVGCEAKSGGELDSVSSPYLTGILTDGRVGILTGRGCTYHCQYCCFAALGRKRLRLHSIERVLAELEYIAAHQKRTGEHYLVPIHDDAFTLVPDRAKKLCQAIVERHFDLVLSCITRADKVDDELLSIMREAGFISLAFGLESAVPSVLRATGKVLPPNWPDQDLIPERKFVEKVRESVTAAKQIGFNVGVSIILGLPTESAEDGAATLKFVGELPIDYYMHNFLWVFPGTPLWETYQQYGIETTVNSLGLPTTIQYAYDITKLRPRAKCSLEQDAQLVRLNTADALFGCDAFLGTPGHVAIAVIYTDELSPHTAAWLAEILDIGGLIIQVYPFLKRSEYAVRLYHDRTTFIEYLVPARHHVQVVSRPNKKVDMRWMLACSGVDLYCSHKPRLLSLEASSSANPLVEWAESISSHCDLCDLSEYLNSPRDLHRLLDQIEEIDIGAYLQKMPVPPGIQYPGRWLRGTAPCLSLTRIEIDQEGNVRPCRHGKTIGRVGDSLELMLTRLNAFAQEAEQSRGCNACSNTHCPRCPFPGIEQENYCTIMKKEQRVLDFLNMVHLYSKFPLILEMQRDRVGNA